MPCSNKIQRAALKTHYQAFYFLVDLICDLVDIAGSSPVIRKLLKFDGFLRCTANIFIRSCTYRRGVLFVIVSGKNSQRQKRHPEVLWKSAD